MSNLRNDNFNLRMDYEARVMELDQARSIIEERNQMEEALAIAEESRKKELLKSHFNEMNILNEENTDLRKEIAILKEKMQELQTGTLGKNISDERNLVKEIVEAEIKAAKETEATALRDLDLAVNRCRALETENHRVRSLLLEQNALVEELDCTRKSLCVSQTQEKRALETVEDLKEQLAIANAKVNQATNSSKALLSNSPKLRANIDGYSTFQDILKAVRPASASSSSSTGSSDLEDDEVTAPLERIMRRKGATFIPDRQSAVEAASKYDTWRQKARVACEELNRVNLAFEGERQEHSLTRMKLSYSESAVNRLKDEISSFQSDLTEREDTVLKLHKDLSTIRGQMDVTRSSLFERNSELKSTREELSKTKERLSVCESTCLNLERSLGSSRHEVENLQVQIKQNLILHNQECSRLKEEIYRQKELLASAQAQNASDWHSQVSTLKQQLLSKENELQEQKTNYLFLKNRMDSAALIPGLFGAGDGGVGSVSFNGREGELIRKQEELQGELNSEKRRVRNLEIQLDGAQQRHARDAKTISDLHDQLQQVEQQSTSYKTQLMMSRNNEQNLKTEVLNERIRLQKLSIALTEARQGGMGGNRLDETASNLTRRHTMSLSKSLETTQMSLKEVGEKFEACMQDKLELMGVIQAALHDAAIRSDLESIPREVEDALNNIISSHRYKTELQRLQLSLKETAVKEAAHATRIAKELFDLASTKHALEAELAKLTRVEQMSQNNGKGETQSGELSPLKQNKPQEKVLNTSENTKSESLPIPSTPQPIPGNISNKSIQKKLTDASTKQEDDDAEFKDVISPEDLADKQEQKENIPTGKNQKSPALQSPPVDGFLTSTFRMVSRRLSNKTANVLPVEPPQIPQNEKVEEAQCAQQ
eukprot:GDKK01052317.1.p1 GENE.GDKK01052317.1~~GDKK01052317.1.p1  ORF type:complete len:944 (+),score=228.62 GDKK01052317.1:174-2834(+)